MERGKHFLASNSTCFSSKTIICQASTTINLTTLHNLNSQDAGLVRVNVFFDDVIVSNELKHWTGLILDVSRSVHVLLSYF